MDIGDGDDISEYIANGLLVFNRRFVQDAKHGRQETIQLGLRGIPQATEYSDASENDSVAYSVHLSRNRDEERRRKFSLFRSSLDDIDESGTRSGIVGKNRYDMQGEWLRFGREIP